MLYAKFHIDYNEKQSFQYELSAESGDVCVVSAPSGQGKTSMFKALSGLQEISEGQIQLVDKVWNSGRGLGIKPQQRDVVLAFQTPALVEHFTVLKNIRLFNPSIDSHKLDDYLEHLGLLSFKKQRISELSGGQKKRVEFLKALLSNAQLVLLDEPFNGSESSMIEKMLKLIAKEKELGQKIFIINSHIEFEFRGLKCFEMINGSLLQVEKEKEVFDEV